MATPRRHLPQIEIERDTGVTCTEVANNRGQPDVHVERCGHGGKSIRKGTNKMQDSKIEWTHNTFNPWWGCTNVSPACDNCHAERFANGRPELTSHCGGKTPCASGAATRPERLGPVKSIQTLDGGSLNLLGRLIFGVRRSTRLCLTF